MSLPQLGRYEITGTVGRGAMGVVYRARDPLIERTVALKTVACGTLSDKDAAEFEQRFFREAKSAGRLSHPNIVTIHDVGRDGELAWIAMEFLSGRSLRDLLDTGEPLSFTRSAEIVAAVADGLAFAHAQGIVHRDVKPANIMVLDNGSVKLTDFGIAQLPNSGLTMAGAVLGSPKYMSPEQVAGEKADGRADIFSLGAVLYELLTGQPPFAGDNLHATMYQVVHTEAPPPSSRRAGLPLAFDAIVTKAMAKDPAARYPDAAEMATALRQAQHTATTAQPSEAAGSNATTDAPISPAPRASAALRKGMLIGSAALIAIGAAFALLRPAQPPETPKVSASTAPAQAAAGVRPAEDKGGTTARAPEKKDHRSAPASAKTTNGWQAALRADLKACETESVFKRVVCIEKARWKHCPGHWGSIADCPANTGEKPPNP